MSFQIWPFGVPYMSNLGTGYSKTSWRSKDSKWGSWKCSKKKNLEKSQVQGLLSRRKCLNMLQKM